MTVSVEMTAEVLNHNIGALTTAIALVQKRKEETYSGVDQLMLDSFIIETQNVLAVLQAAKPEVKQEVFSYATSPEG